MIEPIDLTRKAAVENFVAGSIADLPQHLRLGIIADSILLESITRFTHRGKIPDSESLRALMESWESNPFTPIRQYARLFTSLTLFADQELRGALNSDANA